MGSSSLRQAADSLEGGEGEGEGVCFQPLPRLALTFTDWKKV